MRPLTTRPGAILALGLSTLLLFAQPVISHTWGEQQYRIALNGTFIGEPGYSRGYKGRDDPTFKEDNVVWLIPPNDPNRAKKSGVWDSDKAVRPDIAKLTNTSYSDKFPMLKVAPGDWVAFLYTENGHVSKQDLPGAAVKPINRGTVYLYGTTNNDLSGYNLVDIHLKWTSDGKGGDGNGRLLATRHYDDGQCYEAIPSGGDLEGITTHRKSKTGLEVLPCQSDFQLPKDLNPGEIYTMLWVWDWPDAGRRGLDVPPAIYNATSFPDGNNVTIAEIYTSVADYKIVDPCSDELGDTKGPTCGAPRLGGRFLNAKDDVNFVPQTDFTRAAIKTQMENHFLVEVPQAGFNQNLAMAKKSYTPPAHYIPMANLIGRVDPVNSTLPDNYFVLLPVGGSPSPSPISSAPAPSQPPVVDGAGILTVTVTVPQTTVFVTETKTSTVAESSSTAAPALKKKRSSNLRHGWRE